MFRYIRKSMLGSITAVVVLTISFVLVSAPAIAQSGVQAVKELEQGGMPAFYACLYGNWGCPQPSIVETVASGSMPAFYACQYGNWGCRQLSTLIADPVDTALPAFYACQYGNWGCPQASEPSAPPLDAGMPAFYACMYGDWGCQ